MSEKYVLINPIIVGDLQTEFTVSSSMKACEEFWKEFTINKKCIINQLKKFAITMQEVSSGKLHHFLISEFIKNDNVEYNIKDITKEVQIDDNMLKQFLNEVNRIKDKKTEIEGGGGGEKRKRYDSSSSSSSSSDYHRKKRRYHSSYHSSYSILSEFVYQPSIYETVISNVSIPIFSKIYSPVFDIIIPSHVVVAI